MTDNKKLTNFEVRKIQLSILDYLKKVCEENQINYYLAYGSLLGAIRHQGYIPWDDDIDIWLVREDYEKLLKIFSNEGRYKLFENSIESSYLYPFAKLIDSETTLIEETDIKFEKLGVNIDIFPLDKIIANKNDLRMMKFYRKIYEIKSIKNKKERTIEKRIILKILKILFKFYSLENVIKKINYLSRKNENIEDGYKYAFVFESENIFEKEDFEVTDKLFEGKKYLIPKNFERVLEVIYGDYMKLPPKDKRKSHHSFIAFANKKK